MLWTSWLGRRHAIRSAKAARLSSRSSAAWRPHGRLVPPFVAQVGKAVRKQVYDLTLADFDVAPVWEFASDEGGRGTRTVRPYEVSFPIDAAGHGGRIFEMANLPCGAVFRLMRYCSSFAFFTAASVAANTHAH
jgi:hypothetical protein